MRRLPLQLLSLCLCGALLLCLCQGNEDEDDYEDEYFWEYDSTATPDYDNSTLEYLYFDNSSNVDYNSFVIMKPKSEGTQESNDKRNMNLMGRNKAGSVDGQRSLDEPSISAKGHFMCTA